MNHKIVQQLDELKQIELKAVTAKYQGFLALLNNGISMAQLERNTYTSYSHPNRRELKEQLIHIYLATYPEREEEIYTVMKLANILEPDSRVRFRSARWGMHLKDLKENWKMHKDKEITS